MLQSFYPRRGRASANEGCAIGQACEGKTFQSLYFSVVGMDRICNRSDRLALGMDPVSMVFKVPAPYLYPSLALLHSRHQRSDLPT